MSRRRTLIAVLIPVLGLALLVLRAELVGPTSRPLEPPGVASRP